MDSAEKLRFTAEETREIIKSYGVFRFMPVELRHIEHALTTSDSAGISFWDALIVEAAAASECKVLLTEDLNHGQIIRGVRICNPFLPEKRRRTD